MYLCGEICMSHEICVTETNGIKMGSWLCSIMIGHCNVCYQRILSHSRVMKCAVCHGTLQKLFNPFDFNDNGSDIPLNDVDPGLNFYNEIFGSISTICNYHNEDSFNDKIPNYLNDSQRPLSICHINIRSMIRNFNAFEEYLAGLRFEYAFIGVSETWLTDNNHDLFNLYGYTFIEQHRIRKTGDGVGLFLKDHIEYNLR